MKSAPQYPMAVDRACWHGEPVVMVVAQTRALAEDAAELVEIEWEELPVVTHKETALDPGTPVLHPELGDNLAFRKVIDTGGVDAAFAAADVVVEGHVQLRAAHRGEPRAAGAARRLRQVHAAADDPYQQPGAAHDPDRVRAHARRAGAQRAGGGARRRRLVRLEDSHLRRRDRRDRGGDGARPAGEIHRRPARIVRLRHSCAREPHRGAHGREQGGRDPGARHRRAFRRRRLFAISRAPACSRPTRSSTSPAGPYAAQALSRQGDRGLSQQGADLAIPRRRPPDRQLGRRGAGRHGGGSDRPRSDRDPAPQHHGRRFLSAHHGGRASRCRTCRTSAASRRWSSAWTMRRCGASRRSCAGRASTAASASPPSSRERRPGPHGYYGAGGAPIASQDACTIKLDPGGGIICAVGVTEQGQGVDTVMGQIAASVLGVPMEQLRVISGDTDATPYGGGTYASRATAIGGEAVRQAAHGTAPARSSRIAGMLLQAAPSALDHRRRPRGGCRQHAGACRSPRSAASATSRSANCRTACSRCCRSPAGSAWWTISTSSPTASTAPMSRSIPTPASSAC